ncbi:hypothetical protein SCHPADRAFT_824051 [Schizopora paradoxa]|uniref:HMG box domain-containing protein n=1 Tax=Schizopora paradoxa TaxID=27342 RepID=A0A0H2S2C8_9AGAM|nr:hypothetical protein SCHPADRAFT_824051 [Schizopora paradoxa]
MRSRAQREPSTSPSVRGSSVEQEGLTDEQAGAAGGRTPARSELRPPKLAPSTWQLYFTDWIQRHQQRTSALGDEDGGRKLNVAQAAKEAGAEYASLTPEQKEPFKRRSQAAKEARERELAAWQKTLTPDAIKRENAFRAAQRKAGKSRKGNIKDPNAPKKPLSAYFMFLQHIRSDSRLVEDVFGSEKETTAQSVLAAKKWRSMTDDERKPFLAQAEKEKLDYEAARRMYEEGTVGFETTISFGNDFIAPPSLLSSNAGFSVSGTSVDSLGQAGIMVAPTPALTSGSNSDSEPESEGEARVFAQQQQQRPQQVKTPKKHLRA